MSDDIILFIVDKLCGQQCYLEQFPQQGAALGTLDRHYGMLLPDASAALPPPDGIGWMLPPPPFSPSEEGRIWWC